MDIVHNKRTIKVVVPEDLKDELANTIHLQKEALGVFVTADQLLLYQKVIDKAIDLNGKALEAETFENNGFVCEIYFENPIKPMIDEAVELQNKLIRKLEQQTINRENDGS